MKYTPGWHKSVTGEKTKKRSCIYVYARTHISHTHTLSILRAVENSFKQLVINNALGGFVTWLTEVHKALIFKTKG